MLHTRRPERRAPDEGNHQSLSSGSSSSLVLAAILLGIRRGGVALGLIGGLGVAVLVLVFRTPPSEPPIAVMLIILAVVTASATLQVAGGLDYLVQLDREAAARPPEVRDAPGPAVAPSCSRSASEPVTPSTRSCRSSPTWRCARGIRPERPMAISSVASQMGITASPVAAAVTTFLGLCRQDRHPGRTLRHHQGHHAGRHHRRAGGRALEPQPRQGSRRRTPSSSGASPTRLSAPRSMSRSPPSTSRCPGRQALGAALLRRRAARSSLLRPLPRSLRCRRSVGEAGAHDHGGPDA